MPKCFNCNKKTSVILDCKTCPQKYCTGCIMIEIHNCTGSDDYKKKLREDHQEKIIGERCISTKV